MSSSSVTVGHIYRSSDPSPIIPTNESIMQLLMHCNPDKVRDDKVVLQEHGNRKAALTYGGIRKVAAQGAAGLKQVLRLKPGDTVAVLGANSISWASLAYSAFWAGVTLAAINPAVSPYELVHYLSVSDPCAIFLDSDMLVKFQEAQKIDQSRKLDRMTAVMMGPAAEKPSTANVLNELALTGKQPQWPRDFFSSGLAPVFDLSKFDNSRVPAMICFSSGTSGKPKAVQLSHRSLIAHALGPRTSTPESYNSRSAEVFYAPMCHIFGVAGCLLACAFIGNFILIMRAFKFHEYLRACEEIRATVMRMVPPTAMAMSKDPLMSVIDLTSVDTILSAGASLGQETQTRLQKLLGGANVVQGYGMTECAISAPRKAHAGNKMGSVGALFALVEIRVVDGDLKDVPKGEIGEFIVDSPTMFMGYKNNSDDTAEAFPLGDRWLRTGDVGYCDEDGFLWLTGRKKELIKYKGNQVPPAELEDVILQHPAVHEGAVCATWDAEQETEIPLAYVNFKPGYSAEDTTRLLNEVCEFVNKRVAAYKKLYGGVHYLETIPRNPTGKLLRRLLPASIELEARYAKNKRSGRL